MQTKLHFQSSMILTKQSHYGSCLKEQQDFWKLKVNISLAEKRKEKKKEIKVQKI